MGVKKNLAPFLSNERGSFVENLQRGERLQPSYLTKRGEKERNVTLEPIEYHLGGNPFFERQV